MPNDSHERAAEFHELAGHAHRAAAAHHGKDDHDRIRTAGIIRPRHLDGIQQPRQVLLFVVSRNDY